MTNNFKFIILVSTIVLCVHVSASPDPIVQIKNGKLKGKYYDLKNGDQAVGFLGVPFASPPIGELRFKLPLPPQPWDGVRNATEFAQRCVQTGRAYFRQPPAGQSEDCLYLNIFSPKVKKQVHPVMVFIHGGAFMVGSTYEYGDQGICDFLVARGVVVVTIQYRLGLFGFLSTDDADAPGNYGIWDQIEALKWIKENIGHFGGDHSEITIFGESAGSVSVSLLYHTPYALNLFHRAICQSGSAYSAWANSAAISVEATPILAEVAGCPFGESKELLDCLRLKTTEELLQANDDKNAKWSQIASTFLAWGPRFDNVLFPEQLEKLAEKVPKRPIIIGINSDEEILFLKPPDHVDLSKSSFGVFMIEDDEQFAKVGLNVWLRLLSERSTVSEQMKPVFRELLKYVYFDAQPNADMKNASYVVEQFIQLQNDNFFHMPAYAEAMKHAAANQSVWFYEFGHYPKTYFKRQNYRGSIHTMELPFIFGSSLHDLMKFEWSEEDFKVAEIMTRLWTNFAKSGNPTPQRVQGITWQQFKPNKPQNLFIDSRPKMKKTFRPQYTQFWTELVPKLDSILSVDGGGLRMHQEHDHRQSGERATTRPEL